MITMNVTLIGDAERPVIAVVGTWDPFAPDCERLLAQLIGAARAQGIGAAAVMLDPPPKVHLEGEHAFPLFHDSTRRLDLVRRSGVDLVIQIDFAREDLFRTAADFFDAVCPHVCLIEFWLKHGQDLGRNVAGSELAVSLACRKRSIRFRVLSKDPEAIPAHQARYWLARGCVGAATRAAGCRPSFSRPLGGTLRLAWPTGRYELVDPQDPGRRVSVEAIPASGNMSTIDWPVDSAHVLEVVCGPASDDPADYAYPDVMVSSNAEATGAARMLTFVQELFHASGTPRF